MHICKRLRNIQLKGNLSYNLFVHIGKCIFVNGLETFKLEWNFDIGLLASSSGTRFVQITYHTHTVIIQAICCLFCYRNKLVYHKVPPLFFLCHSTYMQTT